jgi:hypothetical protein
MKEGKPGVMEQWISIGYGGERTEENCREMSYGKEEKRSEARNGGMCK